METSTAFRLGLDDRKANWNLGGDQSAKPTSDLSVNLGLHICPRGWRPAPSSKGVKRLLRRVDAAAVSHGALLLNAELPPKYF